MRWAEPIGGLLAMLVFGLAPFVNNTLVGVLLGACGAYWILLTLSDDELNGGEGRGDVMHRVSTATPIHLLLLYLRLKKKLFWGSEN
jgi:putative inorganic carbon (HCO3(-)) transporter